MVRLGIDSDDKNVQKSFSIYYVHREDEITFKTLMSAKIYCRPCTIIKIMYLTSSCY